MDPSLKAKVNEVRKFINSSYNLRSASKSNVSRRQGVYAKFMNKANTTRSLNEIPQRFPIRNDVTVPGISFVRDQNSYVRQQRKSPVRNGCDSTFREAKRQVGKNGEGIQATRYNPSPQKRTDSSQMQRNRVSSSRIGDFSQRRNSISPPRRINDSHIRRQDRSIRSPSRDSRRPPTAYSRASPVRNSSQMQRNMVSSSRIASVSLRRSSSLSPQRRPNDTQIRSEYVDKRSRSCSVSNTPPKTGLHQNVTLMSPRVVLHRLENIDINRPVRDNDGFLIPTFPAPQKKEHFAEQKRTVLKLLSEFSNYCQPIEEFYFLNKIEKFLVESKKNQLMNTHNIDPVLDGDKSVQIANWLQSSKNSEAGPSQGGSDIFRLTQDMIRKYPASVISGYHKSTIAPSVSNPGKQFFILGKWTLIKGENPIDVMVSGDLLDVFSQALVEENHVSSRVTVANGTIVQTNVCVYSLTNEFVDHSRKIPSVIKKYFEDGKFPKEWKEVIKLWSVLKNKEESSLQSCTLSNRRVANATFYESRVVDRERTDVDRDYHRLRQRDESPVSERDDESEDSEDKVLQQMNERTQRIEEENKRLIAERIRDRRLEEERERRRDEEQESRRTSDGRGSRVVEKRERRIVEKEVDRRGSGEVSRQESNYTRREVYMRVPGRKRTSDESMDEESVQHKNKRARVEPVKKPRLATPGNALRTSSIMTRSSKKRLNSFECTPKSSKVRKLKSRRKTPMPPKGRRIVDCLSDESLSINGSDLQ